jgi:hypothetical protein
MRRVIHQNAERFRGRHVPNKVLSLHEPTVVSIRKGKRAKAAEYGSKVSLSIDRHGFVITHTAYASKIAAPETLPKAITGWRARPHAPRLWCGWWLIAGRRWRSARPLVWLQMGAGARRGRA